MEIVSLDELAEQINSEHLQCESAVNKAISHAYKCGVLLTQAKQSVRHGQWGEWLGANCIVGNRMAQNYMRLAENYTPETLTSSGSIRQAIAALSEPKAQRVADSRAAWEEESFIEDCRKWPDVFITNTHLMLALRMDPSEIAALTGKSEEQVLRVANPTLLNRFVKRGLNSFSDLNGLFAKDYNSQSDTWTMLDDADGYIQHYEGEQKRAIYSTRERFILGALEIAKRDHPIAESALEYAIHQNQCLLNSIKDYSQHPSPFKPFPVAPAWVVLLSVTAEEIRQTMPDWSPWIPWKFEPNVYVPKALAAMLEADHRYVMGIDEANSLDTDQEGNPVAEENRACIFVAQAAIRIWLCENCIAGL
jgi:hypothetical protein